MQATATIESFPAPGSIPRANQLRAELRAFALLLLVCNAPLVIGRSTDAFAFLPRAVAAGEWWRVVTHPFAHISWYHLLLDGSAFLFLYKTLGSKDRRSRLGAVAAGALGSVGTAYLACPLVADLGLCGLSGVAHGLLAITAAEMIATATVQTDRLCGLLCLTVVVAKSCLEALTGHAVLAILHFGMLGTPIAICHAGGVLGGLIFFAFYPPTSVRASAARAVER